MILAAFIGSINSSRLHLVTYNRVLQSGNTIVFNLRQDVFEKKKVLTQRLDSCSILNSEPKTVIQSRYTRLLTEDSNSDMNTIDRESSLKTDSVITSTTEEKQHRSVPSKSDTSGSSIIIRGYNN